MQPITWTVIHGKWLWHQIGFPTANIFCDSKKLQAWTRRRNVVIKNKETRAMNNEQRHSSSQQSNKWERLWAFKALGPYFPDQKLLEAHLLNFDGDLYGQQITVYPLQWIRPNEQFQNFDMLAQKIQKDKQRVKQHPITVLTFWTFDHFHPGHAYYLSQAKKRWDELITIIARDETVTKLKGSFPQHNESIRQKKVQESGIAHHVLLGEKNNHYQCLHNVQPHIICLGYDQHSFDEGIIHYCQKNKLPIPKIIRLTSYQPEHYKSSHFQKE